MAQCDFCGTTILFAGVRDGELRFCNEECHANGSHLLVARRVPESIVEEYARRLHRGRCPRCKGSGPVDVHMSHRIYSLILYSSWRSRPHICCRSCGVKSQVGDTLYCLLFGWWGIPWGLVLTPVQIFKNMVSIFRRPDALRPSEKLKHLVSLEIAANAMAQRKESTT